jgi:hypothetical protein
MMMWGRLAASASTAVHRPEWWRRIGTRRLHVSIPRKGGWRKGRAVSVRIGPWLYWIGRKP